MNQTMARSGLLYVCGHPGTGKTSVINSIVKGLSRENEEVPVEEQVIIFNYNGMTFSNLKEFAIRMMLDGMPKLMN